MTAANSGEMVEAGPLPELDRGQLLALYRGMVRLRMVDERLMTLQRQGRIGFYGAATGQEAAVIGSVAALGPSDFLFPALREAGAALYLGLPLRSYLAQIFGNANDTAKGRQMPCHPTFRAGRYVSMSSCIGTQLPHAVGVAMAARITKTETVVLGYLGDGATSTADFHVAMNFAAVYRSPVIFFCQNNQWAISTPLSAQTRSVTLAAKAQAYGMPGVRVDGNDVVAVHGVTREAVAKARAGMGPTFIEALTYRVGPHSSSDDPSRYRDETITREWRKRDPIERFRSWLMAARHLAPEEEERLRAEIQVELDDAIAREETVPAPDRESLITEVFSQVPWHLSEQWLAFSRR